MSLQNQSVKITLGSNLNYGQVSHSKRFLLSAPSSKSCMADRENIIENIEDKYKPASLYQVTDEGRRTQISTEQYYEYLIDTYQNLVFSVCFKIVNDYFDAEDLAQETFLSAFQHLSAFDRKYEKAWLCKIATNKCLDYLKRSERLSVPTDEEYFTMQKDREPSPEENALETEVKQQLYERCGTLKPPYREVALDYFYRELQPAQIAERSGKNLKTIQTQIYRAKAMLQKKYRKEAV